MPYLCATVFIKGGLGRVVYSCNGFNEYCDWAEEKQNMDLDSGGKEYMDQDPGGKEYMDLDPGGKEYMELPPQESSRKENPNNLPQDPGGKEYPVHLPRVPGGKQYHIHMPRDPGGKQYPVRLPRKGNLPSGGRREPGVPVNLPFIRGDNQDLAVVQTQFGILEVSLT